MGWVIIGSKSVPFCLLILKTSCSLQNLHCVVTLSHLSDFLMYRPSTTVKEINFILIEFIRTRWRVLPLVPLTCNELSCLLPYPTHPHIFTLNFFYLFFFHTLPFMSQLNFNWNSISQEIPKQPTINIPANFKIQNKNFTSLLRDSFLF